MANATTKSTTTTINTAADFSKAITSLTAAAKPFLVKGKVSKDAVTDAAAIAWLLQSGPTLLALVNAAKAAKAAAVESGKGSGFKGAAKVACSQVAKAKVNTAALKRIAVAQMKRLQNISDVEALFLPHIKKSK